MSTSVRYNMYRMVHKGLRAYMADTLVALGRLDTGDAAAVSAMAGRLRGFLEYCHGHLGNEDRHVHTAMEARRPGSTAQAADDHHHHHQAFVDLERGVAALEVAAPADRAEVAHDLYLALALFVAENLVHMNVEETHNNAILWDAFSDAELIDIERGIVATLPPHEGPVMLRWSVPAAAPAERVAFLAGVREAVPADVFDGIVSLVSAHMPAAEAEALAAGLAPQASAA